MEDIMESRKSFLVVLSLVLAGSLISSNDAFSAKKQNNTRKSTKKSNSKKGKTTSKNHLSTSSDAERRGSTSTTTTSTSTTTTTYANPQEEAYALTSNLMQCLQPSCRGKVEYEKCFKTSQITKYIELNNTCNDYMNKASADARALATSSVRNKIKKYFQESCDAAYGEIHGDNCEVQITYYAKLPNGNSVKKAKIKNVGDTFTCDPAIFDIDTADLEYTPEKTAEEKAANIQNTINFITGALDTGVKIYSAVKSSQDLKKAAAYKRDAWYKFDGKTLSIEKTCATYDYGAEGKGMSNSDWNKQKDNDVICETDLNGAKYCKLLQEKTDEYVSSNDNRYKNCKEDASKHKCSDISEDSGFSTCSVFIEKSNELKEQETLADLIKNKADLNALKEDADNAQYYLTLTKAEQQYNFAQQFNGSSNALFCNTITFTANTMCSSNSSNGSTNWTCPGTDANSKTLITSLILNKNDTVNDKTILNYNINSACERNNKNEVKCLTQDNHWENENGLTVTNVNQTNGHTCSWDGNDWVIDIKNSGSTSSSSLRVNQIRALATGSKGTKCKCNEDNYGISDKDLDAYYYCQDTCSIKKYNSTVSAYNSAVTTSNQKKKELEEAEAQAQSSLQDAISTGTQLVLTTGSQLLISNMTGKRKEVATGACYIGDPKNGHLFASEGETKKIPW